MLTTISHKEANLADDTLSKLLPHENDDFENVQPINRIDSYSSSNVLTLKEHAYELQAREQIIKEKDEAIRQHKEEHELRKLFLHLVFWFVVIFVIVIMTCLVLCTTGIFHLTEKVQMTLLGTTTIDIVGLLYIAFKWLFPKR